MKFFIYSIISIVGIAVVAGFFIVGSPQEERMRRFDERRVQDLQMLQGEILNFWQLKEYLPETLEALRDDIRGVRAPYDPETNGSYGYSIKDSETFSLCATFGLESEQYGISEKTILGEPTLYTQPVDYLSFGGNWEHGIGNVCFERHIDKALYAKKKE